MLNSLRNPESFLQMASSQNPLIAQALSLGKQNGGNYDAITEAILQNAGYDTAAVREQLVEAGIL